MFSSPSIYSIPRQGNPIRVEIKKPGIYYLGAFKYKHIGGGLFGSDEFDVVRMDGISQKDVLSELLPFAEGNAWETPLKKHASLLR